MSEQGGSATQSGISYQNLYVAFRIAEMLSGQDLPATSKIIGVRVEAPESVDDVVVTYEDGHRDYLKNRVSLEIEEAVVAMAIEYPAYGLTKLASFHSRPPSLFY